MISKKTSKALWIPGLNLNQQNPKIPKNAGTATRRQHRSHQRSQALLPGTSPASAIQGNPLSENHEPETPHENLWPKGTIVATQNTCKLRFHADDTSGTWLGAFVKQEEPPALALQSKVRNMLLIRRFRVIHTYIHTYMPTYIHAYTPTYLHTYIHAYIHTHMHTYIHTYVHTHTLRTFCISPCMHARPSALLNSCETKSPKDFGDASPAIGRPSFEGRCSPVFKGVRFRG